MNQLHSMFEPEYGICIYVYPIHFIIAAYTSKIIIINIKTLEKFGRYEGELPNQKLLNACNCLHQSLECVHVCVCVVFHMNFVLIILKNNNWELLVEMSTQILFFFCIAVLTPSFYIVRSHLYFAHIYIKCSCIYFSLSLVAFFLFWNLVRQKTKNKPNSNNNNKTTAVATTVTIISLIICILHSKVFPFRFYDNRCDDVTLLFCIHNIGT